MLKTEELEKNRELAENQQLTKKERRFLRREQREEERLRSQRQRKLKKFSKIAVGILIAGGVILSGIWFLATRPPIPESEIISKQGLHWHADLTVKILGQYQEVPADIGIPIIGSHSPVHTHELDKVIHMEFSNLVMEKDIILEQFFKNWGKKFNKDCIFDECNGPKGQLKVLVNKEPNYEFEDYIMRDKDKIEIIFE